MEFHLLHISMLREYLELEFGELCLKSKIKFYSLENIIDDMILMCFFVGNDFLPNVPGLDIGEGSLNKMFQVYKDLLSELGGYLTNRGYINFARLKVFFNRLKNICVLDGEERSSKNDNDPLPIEKEEFLNYQLEGKDSSSGPVLDDQVMEKLTSDMKEILGVNENPAPPKSESLASTSEDNDEEIILLKPEFFKMSQEEFQLQSSERYWREKYYKERFSTFSESLVNDLVQAYIEGIVWVLQYYYHGCVSWGWYFPYYYAPTAQDLEKYLDVNREVKFDKGVPFFPFQQLISVLPPASRELLPSSYQQLMLDPNSPIRDFFPDRFRIDMVGKKVAWEAVVVLPFINQQRLLSAVESLSINDLTEEERNRNKFGSALLFQYDPKEKSQVISTLPSVYDNIAESNSSCTPYLHPALADEKVSPFELVPGVKTGLENPPLFPTLKSLEDSFEIQIRNIGVFIFNYRTQKESFVIRFPKHEEQDQNASRSSQKPQDQKPSEGDKLKDDKLKAVADDLLGKVVLVDWPYHQEALVVGVSCAEHRHLARPPFFMKHTSEQKAMWIKENKYIAHNLLYKKAVQLEDCSVIVHVRRLQYMQMSNTRKLTKIFSISEEAYPLELVVRQGIVRDDSRFAERAALPMATEFPVGTDVVIISGNMFGGLGKVVEHEGQGLLHVEVEHPLPQPNFGHRVAAQIVDKYLTLSAVSRITGMSSRSLSRITGSIFVEPGRHDIGLNIKFSGKNLQVMGYSRKNTGWEFSEKAINLIKSYAEKFPRVFELLEKSDRSEQSDSFFNLEELFPDEARLKKLKDIEDWLHKLEHRSLPKVLCGTQSMCSRAIAAVETEAKRHVELETGLKRQKAVRSLSPLSVIAPVQDDRNIFPEDHFVEIGDRVMNLKGFGHVPFGAQGTVVVAEETGVSVVFDQEFIGGTNLYNCLSTCRGFSGLDIKYLLNLSYPDDINQGAASRPQSNKQAYQKDQDGNFYDDSNLSKKKHSQYDRGVVQGRHPTPQPHYQSKQGQPRQQGQQGYQKQQGQQGHQRQQGQQGQQGHQGQQSQGFQGQQGQQSHQGQQSQGFQAQQILKHERPPTQEVGTNQPHIPSNSIPIQQIFQMNQGQPVPQAQPPFPQSSDTPPVLNQLFMSSLQQPKFPPAAPPVAPFPFPPPYTHVPSFPPAAYPGAYPAPYPPAFPVSPAPLPPTFPVATPVPLPFGTSIPPYLYGGHSTSPLGSSSEEEGTPQHGGNHHHYRQDHDEGGRGGRRGRGRGGRGGRGKHNTNGNTGEEGLTWQQQGFFDPEHSGNDHSRGRGRGRGRNEDHYHPRQMTHFQPAAGGYPQGPTDQQFLTPQVSHYNNHQPQQTLSSSHTETQSAPPQHSQTLSKSADHHEYSEQDSGRGRGGRGGRGRGGRGRGGGRGNYGDQANLNWQQQELLRKT